MRSQRKTRRPFAMSPTGAGNNWSTLDMDVWLAETVLDEGFVCQVSWREQQRMTWQVANFSSTQKGAEYARSMPLRLFAQCFTCPSDASKTEKIHAIPN